MLPVIPVSIVLSSRFLQLEGRLLPVLTIVTAISRQKTAIMTSELMTVSGRLCPGPPVLLLVAEVVLKLTQEKNIRFVVVLTLVMFSGRNGLKPFLLNVAKVII